MTQNYKIPKLEKTVLMLVEGDKQQPDEYIVYLNEFSRYRKGPETLFEFLNTDRWFIPAKNKKSGKYVILNTNEIYYLVKLESIEPLDPGADEKPITIHLENGITMDVEHFKPQPDSQSRLVDYLNEKNQFIVFHYEGKKIFLNKNKITRVKDRSRS
ncbi:MAG: hypothetical protein GY765_29540 [bacterium]|nr:hypothetical protein [bacterium]